MNIDIAFNAREAELKGLDIVPMVVKDPDGPDEEIVDMIILYGQEVHMTYHGEEVFVWGKPCDDYIKNLLRWLNEHYVDHLVMYDDEEED